MKMYEADNGMNQHEEGDVEITMEEFDEQKAALEDASNLGDAMQRLRENDDFKMIIEQKYFQDEPARMGMLLASDRLPASNRENVVKDLVAIASLKTFLTSLLQAGEIAKESLKDLEQARVEALNAGVPGVEA